MHNVSKKQAFVRDNKHKAPPLHPLSSFASPGTLRAASNDSMPDRRRHADAYGSRPDRLMIVPA